MEHEYKFILQNHFQHFDARLFKKTRIFSNKYLEKIVGVMRFKIK